ncbi:MAG TPA: 2-oxo-4-hydroxy-4-carboxy-5-ureidoimidazoline decarboxylase [Gemmatimonadaceae bacterium]|nr:2-oxo-4-hydroxy-4-carboxy-5-ureidoimidazoline decarboxylase [Gemmatimonadaceae bacterium]
MTLEALNALSDHAARDALTACCGTPRWVAHMLDARPFASREAFFREADDAWRQLTLDDMGTAIANHPRIGETPGATPRSAVSAGWSKSEQSGALEATDAVRAAFAQLNVEYELRFGHRFILCALGKSAAEMLSALRTRLTNDSLMEFENTARELRAITTLRLHKLLP